MGFLWGSPKPLTGLADPARVPKSRRLPDPNDHFPVTRCHQGDLADCSNSAPIDADYFALSVPRFAARAWLQINLLCVLGEVISEREADLVHGV